MGKPSIFQTLILFLKQGTSLKDFYSVLIKHVDKSRVDAVLSDMPASADPGKYLVYRKVIDYTSLASIYAKQLDLSTVDLKNHETVDTELIHRIEPALMQNYFFIPLGMKDNHLLIAIDNPSDIIRMDELELALSCKILPCVAPADMIAETLGEFFPDYKTNISIDFSENNQTEDEIHLLKDDAQSDQEEASKSEKELTESDSPVVKLVNRLILTAISQRASDLHFEAYETGMIVKIRVDGVLQDSGENIDRNTAHMVISRIKIMSELNIAERHLPQDGRFKLRIRNRDVAFRVSILPSIFGETAVIRVLDKMAMGFSLTDIGFTVDDLVRFEDNIRKPYGMVLVAGPTGSGKTSTLYTGLKRINRPEDKIITIEDPVEYQLQNIVQVPVDSKKGLTFATGLRSIVRQDPDKILIGEIRDEETASIAINAALTGHLVLTTIHSNNAVDTIGRLMNMGIERYMFASAILMIVSQRLVRQLCKRCKRLMTADEKSNLSKRFRWLEREGWDYSDANLMTADGCAYCNKTGYHGRTGAFEIMEITEKIKNMIVSNAPSSEVYKQALNDGMIPLRENCFNKVCQGHTTFFEMDRVTRA